MTFYVRVFLSFVRNAVQREAQYRVNFAISLLDTALGLFAGLVVLQSLFHQTLALGGWSFMESLAVFGVFIMMEQCVELVLAPNLGRLSEYIRLGQLDYMLLKPVDLQFYVSCRNVNLWRVPGMILGLGTTIFSMNATGHLSVLSVVILGMLLIASLTMLYSVWLMFKTTAFWFVRVESLTIVFLTLLGVGRFPVDALPNWLRIVFTAIIPIAFITNVPASVAVGRASLDSAILSFIVAAGLFLVSRCLFRYAVRSYSSASG